MRRREFLEQSGRAAMGLGWAGGLVQPRCVRAAAPPRAFRVWVIGCSHVGTDLARNGRESLAEAIRHSEDGGREGGPPFEWDICLNLGDLSGDQSGPTEEEGRIVVGQYAAARRHRREQFYDLAGNHDANVPGQPSMGWFKKWVDPEGANTRYSKVDPQARPYPIEGTWERYSFRVGNLLFLMMSDRNDLGPPIGRGPRGGYPAGAVTGETFAWWQRAVEQHRDAIIVTAHHHMLKETTFASGEWESFTRNPDGSYRSHYHGYFPDGGPQGASYLYFVDGKPDAQAFESLLAAQPGAIDLWLGGHTHSHPDDTTGGRTHVERKWDVNFVNCAALSRFHARTTMPMSRLFTFSEGSDEVLVQCYLHTSQFAPQGWYTKAERRLKLSKPFQLS